VRAYAKVEEIESERGGTLPQIDDKLLAIIDDLHRNHTLRYSEPSKHGRYPVFGPLQELAEAFLDMCDAPSAEELSGA
ncbi:MAG: hypothetical protein AAF245_07650, partial [Pseudomonadota bacterium]